MAVIVKHFNVRIGAVSYAAGDVIDELSEQEEQKLVDEGHCEFPAVTVSGTVAMTDNLTIEQFTDLKADKQKELLHQSGIEPGSNETARIEQYAHWLEGKGGTENATGESGPNTGLPASGDGK